MSTFNDTRGIPVVSKASAEHIGVVKHFVVTDGHVQAIHVDGGKHGLLVDWADVSALGDDAVLVDDATVLSEASDDRQARALRGDLVMVGKRALDDVGDDIGTVSDVSFDPVDGRIESLTVAGDAIEGERLRGVGSYAVVVASLDGD
jgi:sporulation protein YlmC with PRC-barrel domain